MVDQRHLEALRPETAELLAQLEVRILELGDAGHPVVEPVFRTLHTIKGECGFLGFTDVVPFAHKLEEAFDLVRKGQMPWSRELAKLTLRGQDLLRILIDAHYGGPAADRVAIDDVLTKLQALEDEQTGAKKKAIKAQIGTLLEAVRGMLHSLPDVPPNAPPQEISQTLDQIREAAAVLGADLALFIEKFSFIFGFLAAQGGSTPAGLAPLTLKALAYFPTMVENTDADPNQLDPLVLIESMQKPLEFLQAVEGIARDNGLIFEDPAKAAAAQADLAALGMATAAEVAGGTAKQNTVRVIFRPAAGLLGTGVQLNDLAAELSSFGKLTILRQVDPSEASVADGTALFEAVLTTPHQPAAVRDIFAFAPGIGDLTMQVIDRGEEPEVLHQKIGEILLARGDITHEQLERALAAQFSGRDEGAAGRAERAARAVDRSNAFAFMRVSLDRLTELVNLIGELVALNSGLLRRAQSLDDHELTVVAEDLARIVDRLRDGAMLNRMKPIGETFARFEAMVTGLARDLGKDVCLVIDGADTELDMATQDKLHDPLVHLLRNTVDHGIEKPEVREAAGKPRQGTVRLSAEQTGSTVILRIADDGAGINPERIFAKAVEKGLVPADAKPTLNEIYNYIFLPGFSTATVITNVSGRGTGMDVVKRVIDSLHGTIEIDSKVGAGSTFALKLPLSLAIMEGLLVEVSERHFVLPLMLVEEIVNLPRREHSEGHENNVVNYRGHPLPFLRLRERFVEQPHLPAPAARSGGVPPGTIEQMVVCNIDDRQIGIVVDRVIGENHTLVKSMGTVLRQVTLFSGLTICGDGSIAFILDVHRLVRDATRKSEAA